MSKGKNSYAIQSVRTERNRNTHMFTKQNIKMSQKYFKVKKIHRFQSSRYSVVTLSTTISFSMHFHSQIMISSCVMCHFLRGIVKLVSTACWITRWHIILHCLRVGENLSHLRLKLICYLGSWYELLRNLKVFAGFWIELLFPWIIFHSGRPNLVTSGRTRQILPYLSQVLSRSNHS